MIALVCVVAAAVWVGTRPPATPPRPLVSVTPADLCRTAFADRVTGCRVRVPFRYPLVPTADPLVWEHRPGFPPEHVPPTVRLVFDAPFAPPASGLVVVEGTVSHIAPDTLPRTSKNLGVVVLTACRPVPPE